MSIVIGGTTYTFNIKQWQMFNEHSGKVNACSKFESNKCTDECRDANNCEIADRFGGAKEKVILS